MELLVTTIILLIILLGGDYLVKICVRNKSLVDVFIHGIIGLTIASPLISPYLLLLAFTISTILDVDHFIAAKSMRISDAITLKNRPCTHSLTFGVFISSVIWICTKNDKIAITVALAILSHVLRDAPSRKTLILWPAKFDSIPYWSYIVMEMLLLFICWIFANLSSLL